MWQWLNREFDWLAFEDPYRARLGQIKKHCSDKGRLGMAASVWIGYIKWLLHLDKWCHALSAYSYLNNNNVPASGTFLRLAGCQEIVALYHKASSVLPIPFTHQKYHCTYSKVSGSADSTTGVIRVTYMNSKLLAPLLTNTYLDLWDKPCLKYSSWYWRMQPKRHVSECKQLLAWKLFDDWDNYICTEILLEPQRPHWSTNNHHRLLIFRRFYSSAAGRIFEIVVGVVGVECFNIKQTDCIGVTTLGWAAWNGPERVIEILLEQDDIRTNKLDNIS